MQLVVEQSGDVHILRVQEAKLTYPTLSAFLAEVRKLVEGGARKLLLEMKAVTYADSASIGCLMDIRRLLQEQEGVLKICGLQPRVETLISMTGVNKIIDIHRDEEEALASLSGERGKSHA